MDLRNVCWIAHGLSALLEDEFLQAHQPNGHTRARSQVYQRALHRVRTGAYPLLVWLYNIGMPRKCHVMYEKEMADGDGRV